MKKIKYFFQKIKIALLFIFSNNYIVVLVFDKNIYATANTESVLHLDTLNEAIELTMDDAESFYDYENQINDYSHLN